MSFWLQTFFTRWTSQLQSPDVDGVGTCGGVSRNALVPAATLRRMRPPSSLPTAPSMGHSVAPPIASIVLSSCNAEP